jgi:ribonuclease HI
MGIGGAFRNAEGNLLWIYAEGVEINTNNFVELLALDKGLHIAIKEGFYKLIIEGDSKFVIGMLERLQHGSCIRKISQRW